jgi:hypothetical protein
VARLTLWLKREAARVNSWRALDQHYAVGEFSLQLQLWGWDCPRRFVVIREQLRTERPSLGRKLLEVPGYTFRVFVSNLAAWGGSRKVPAMSEVILPPHVVRFPSTRIRKK